MTILAILDKSPGSAFGLTFPDHPGIFAAADEMLALDEAARDALALDGIAGEVVIAVENLMRVRPNMPVEFWVEKGMLPLIDGMVPLDALCGILRARRAALIDLIRSSDW